MKIRLFILAASLSVLSCAPEKVSYVDYGPRLISMSLHALGTKTTLGEDGAIQWSAGDAISVLDAEGNHRFVTGDSGETAVFKGEAARDMSSTYAVYPYHESAKVSGNVLTLFIPAAQTGRKGSFSEAGNVSVAMVRDSSFTSQSVCGMLKLTVSREDVVSVDIIASDEDVVLSGTFDVKMENGSVSALKAVRGAGSVSLNGGGKCLEPGSYFIGAVPATLENGYSLRVCLSDGRISELEVPHRLVITPSGRHDLGTVDADLNITGEQIVIEFYNVGEDHAVQPFDKPLPSSPIIEERGYGLYYQGSYLPVNMKSEVGGCYLTGNMYTRGLVLSKNAGPAWLRFPALPGKRLCAVGLANGTNAQSTKTFRITKSLSIPDRQSPVASMQLYGSTLSTVFSIGLDGEEGIAYFLFTEDTEPVLTKIVLTYETVGAERKGPQWVQAYIPSRGETTWSGIHESWTVDDLPGFCPVGEPDTDEYGGWKDVMKFQATGWFRCEQKDGRWWMVDPLGNPFISKGLCSFKKYTRNQRFLDAYASVYHSNEKAFVSGEWQRVAEYGFNSFGAFCDEALIKRNIQVPYSLTLTPMTDYLDEVKAGYIEKYGEDCWKDEGPFNFPLVFDEGFALKCRSSFALAASKGFATDQYLMGIMTDNEFPVNDTFLSKCLEWPDTTHINYIEAVKWLDERHLTKEVALDNVDIRRQFAAYCFESYLKKIKAAKDLYFPHHMYWGTKATGANYHTSLLNDWTFKVAADYVDAYSVDQYFTWAPDPDILRKWSKMCGKPLIMAEWYVKGADVSEIVGPEYTNTDGVGWVVPTQKDRGLFYQNYVLKSLESGVVVGWHWFKFYDGHPDPKISGSGYYSSDNCNKGVFSIDLNPYYDCLEQMANLNRQVYPLCKYYNNYE